MSFSPDEDPTLVLDRPSVLIDDTDPDQDHDPDLVQGTDTTETEILEIIETGIPEITETEIDIDTDHHLPCYMDEVDMELLVPNGKNPLGDP